VKGNTDEAGETKTDCQTQRPARNRHGGICHLPAGLVLILFGTIEACSMIYLNQSLKIAAYEGARVSLVPTSNSGNVEAAGNQVLNDRNIQGGTVAVAPSNFDTLPYGTFIAVNVSAPCESNTLFGAIFYAGRDISVTVEMMKES